MSTSSTIFSSFAPRFCQLNTGLLAVAFHIYTAPTEASTDFALFLIILMQKLHRNGFQPFLRRISYAFGPHTVFGLAVFSGNVNEWYDHLKDDGLVGSYSGFLDIPFVTWPIFDNEIEQEIPLNIDLARCVHLTNNIQIPLRPPFKHQGTRATLSFMFVALSYIIKCTQRPNICSHVNCNRLPGIYIQPPHFYQTLTVHDFQSPCSSFSSKL